MLTISREAQEPRKTTEEGLKRAEEVEIPVLDAATVGIDTDRSGRNGSATIVHNVFPPALLEKGTKIQEIPHGVRNDKGGVRNAHALFRGLKA